MDHEFQPLFQQHVDHLRSFKTIKLLKEISKITSEIFAKDPHFKGDRCSLGEENEERVTRAALYNNFEGTKEFSDEFYQVLSAASKRQELTRSFVRQALKLLPHGFSQYDSLLIHHASIVSSAYDPFYQAWCKAVQGNKTALRVAEAKDLDPKFNNHYTIIQLAEDGSFFHEPYAQHFSRQLEPVLTALSDAAQALASIPNLSEEQRRYVEYFLQYKSSLGELDESKLEEQGKRLDELWVDIKHPIQIVHDIESGYGDPLRTKVIPDFSIRFLDDDYSDANNLIANEIKHTMISYFNKRPAELAQKGLFALKNSYAGIYYVPFQCGMSLHFRFAGQSIPNRPAVKDSKGVKIYFDPESTGKRIEATKRLIEKVFQPSDIPTLSNRLNVIDSIVYHVAAHEYGHAIYNLGHLREILPSPLRSLLEEPRAELTSLCAMQLLHSVGLLSKESLLHVLSSFAAQDLRRFAMFSSSATRPYTISAINTYKTYADCGYITEREGKLFLDDSKAMGVLQRLVSQFEALLDAEDRRDVSAITDCCEKMQAETPLISFLVQALK